jgi:hypothetical protein
VQVDANDYLGRPEDEAGADLRDAGLEPVAERRSNPGDEAAGTVAAVRPTGEVDKGSQVTLEVWDEPPGKGDGRKAHHDRGKGKGHGNEGPGDGGGGPLDELPGSGEG